MKIHPWFDPTCASKSPLLAGVLLLAMAACAKSGPDPDDLPVAPAGGHSRVARGQGAPVLKLKPAEIEAIGLKTAVLKQAAHHPTRQAFGVLLDPQSLAATASLLAEAQAQATKAGAALAASSAERERSKRLHEDQDNLSTKAYEAAEAAWRSDQAAAAAAQSALQSANLAARQQWGVALAVWMSQNNAEYRRIEEGENILLRIAVPGAAPAQAPISAAVGLPEGRWAQATFVSNATEVSPEFQSADYFFVMKSGPGLLAGMNVNVLLPVAGSAAPSVDLPPGAILHWQGKTWVYLQTKPGTFSRREISSDAPDGEGGFLATDLPPDPAVVIQGAAALLSEEFKPASGDTD